MIRHLFSCCGLIPLKTAVIIITIFGILNKLSGFYGLLSLDFSDPAASTMYIYSLLAVIVLSFGLYGIYTENTRTIRWYVMFYWLDCLVSTVTTVWFAMKWFVYTDHSLPDLADNPSKQVEHDNVFQMESTVSILLLVLLRVIHVYFAMVLTTFYKSLNKMRYSKLAASVDQELDAHGRLSADERRLD